jgi:hypothetical protein
MKTVEITLYDIFGYFIPGCVALIAVYLIAWRAVLPANQDWITISTLGWIIVAGVAYIMGHFLQALSNVLYSFIWKNPEQCILADISLVPSNILSVAQKAARQAIHISENDDINTKTLYEIMDHYIQQYGKTESRDIYIYREGFYRGLSVGFFFLAIGSLVHMTGGQTIAAAFGGIITLTKPCMGFVAVLSLIIALLAGVRYQRFATYRVKNCLFSFLAICKN